MARKSTDAAKAKAAREKKLLIVLSGVFVLALGYAAMTLHLFGGGKPAAAPLVPVTAPATTTAPAAATPAATPAPGTTDAPPLVGVATASAPPSGAAGAPLVAAVQPAASSGQLESFSRFDSKDPFDANGPKPPTGSTSAPASGSSAAGTPTTPAAGAPATAAVPATTTPAATTTTPTPPAPPPTTAVIAVNGNAASVSTDADFPVSTDPVENGIFHLVGLTATTAQVTIVGGSYASGSPLLTLKVNQPVTLVNTADGKRYTLELFPQGTVPPAAATSSSTPTAAPTTTP